MLLKIRFIIIYSKKTLNLLIFMFEKKTNLKLLVAKTFLMEKKKKHLQRK